MSADLLVTVKAALDAIATCRPLTNGCDCDINRDIIMSSAPALLARCTTAEAEAARLRGLVRWGVIVAEGVIENTDKELEAAAFQDEARAALEGKP